MRSARSKPKTAETTRKTTISTESNPVLEALRRREDGTEVVNVKWVRHYRRRVAVLAQKTEWELAHAAEDEIFRLVLREIALGRVPTLDKAQKLAKAALRTSEINFARTCGPWKH